MPRLDIYGAGPGLGRSTAARFARGGYDVTLIGRNPETLAALAAELGGARTVVADLADVDQVRAVTTQLGGPADVLVYAPGDVSRLPVGAAALTAAELLTWLPLHALGPIELTHTVLPGMLARGSGAVLVAQGVAVTDPVPYLASVSAAQAALLNYLRALGPEVAPGGVRLGSLQIGRLIERSAAARLYDAGHFDGIEDEVLPRVDPDELAETLWGMAHDQPAGLTEVVT